MRDLRRRSRRGVVEASDDPDWHHRLRELRDGSAAGRCACPQREPSARSLDTGREANALREAGRAGGLKFAVRNPKKRARILERTASRLTRSICSCRTRRIGASSSRRREARLAEKKVLSTSNGLATPSGHHSIGSERGRRREAAQTRRSATNGVCGCRLYGRSLL